MARRDHTSIEASLLGQLRKEVHRLLAPHRHTALLAATVQYCIDGPAPPGTVQASTLSASRIRTGTRWLFTMICPRPASVGASTVAKMPASQMETLENTSSAATVPSAMVTNMPILNKRSGRLPTLRRITSLVRLASVKRSKTRPGSARLRKTFALNPAFWIDGREEDISIPATVKTMGGVRIVRSNRPDTRLKTKKSETKMARRNITVRDD